MLVNKSVVSRMVEEINDRLRDLAKEDYCIEYIIQIHQALEDINTVLDELVVQPKVVEPYHKDKEVLPVRKAKSIDLAPTIRERLTKVWKEV